jgi:hypothetical protein
VAALHALGDGYLILALQQGNRAHFPQVKPDRVVIFVEHAWRKVKFALFGDGAMLGIPSVCSGLRGACGYDVIIRGDTNLLKPGEVMLALLRLRRSLDGRQYAIFLFRKEISALLANANNASHLFTRLLIIQ